MTTSDTVQSSLVNQTILLFKILACKYCSKGCVLKLTSPGIFKDKNILTFDLSTRTV